MKKIITFIIAIVMIATTLTACSTAGTPILEYGNSKVTVNMYNYWLSKNKAMYMSMFTGMQDTNEFWMTEIAEGLTAETYLGAMALQSVMNTLVCAEMYDQLGLKISAEMTEVIDGYIAELIVELGGGSKSQFNQLASAYGVNDKILKEIYIFEAKAMELFNYFYGEGGIEPITDAQRDEAYVGNYVKIQHLYINNKYVPVVDEEGRQVADENGSAKVNPMEGDQLAENNAVIAAIDKGIEEGAEYETLWSEYSEDQYYENGYYLTSSMQFITEVLTAAFTMEVGAVQKIETGIGVHYIKKYDLDAKAYADERNVDFFGDFDTMTAQAVFNKKVSDKITEITVHEEEVKKYSIRTVTPNSNF
jgi:hypothetical protein